MNYMERNGKQYYTGLGILDVLQIIFIVLKLVGVVNWSWVVVFIPLWISLIAITVIFIVAGIIVLRMRMKDK